MYFTQGHGGDYFKWPLILKQTSGLLQFGLYLQDKFTAERSQSEKKHKSTDDQRCIKHDHSLCSEENNESFSDRL